MQLIDDRILQVFFATADNCLYVKLNILLFLPPLYILHIKYKWALILILCTKRIALFLLFVLLGFK